MYVWFEPIYKGFRQTGGPGRVVSFNTKDDANLHFPIVAWVSRAN